MKPIRTDEAGECGLCFAAYADLVRPLLLARVGRNEAPALLARRLNAWGLPTYGCRRWTARLVRDVLLEKRPGSRR